MSTSLKIGIVVGLVMFTALFYSLSDYWVWISLAGVVALLLAFFPHTTDNKGALMKLPEEWNDSAIDSALMPTLSNSTMLAAKLEQIAATFIYGKKIEVAKMRIEYLEVFLKMRKLEREAYAWRISIESKLIEEEEAEKLRDFNRKKRLADLDAQAKEEALLTKIEKSKNEREALKNPPPPPVPKEQRAEDSRARQRKEMERRIEALEKEVRITKADPTMDEESKTRKLNTLHDELEEAETERIRLL